MAIKYKDRVAQTTTVTGTAAITFSGTLSGRQTFAAAFSEGDELYYVVEDLATGDWEIGVGIFDAATPSISRDATPVDSSNAGSAVSFAAGEKRVFATLAAEAVKDTVFSPVTTETTTTRTLVLGDANSYILCNNAAGCAITVPAQASVAWAADTEIHGSGSLADVTFVEDTGVTINIPDGFTLGAKAGSVWSLKREAENSWRLVGSLTGLAVGAVTESLIIPCSDESTALTTGTAKVTFRMPYAFTLSAVRASVGTAPTGATITVDINEAGVSILSTKLTIDATEKTSTTAATAAVISDTALADDAEITIDIDQVGSTIAGAGLKVTLIGVQA